MKIPAGHQIKLSKRLEQLRQNNSIPQKTPTPVQKTVNVISSATERKQTTDESSNIPKKSDYIQLEEPTKELAVGDDKSGGEFLQGTFNEAESHQSFLEALNEWRSTKPIEDRKQESRQKNSRSKKVRFVEPEKEEKEEVTKKKVPDNKGGKTPFIFAGGESYTHSEKHSKEIATETNPM